MATRKPEDRQSRHDVTLKLYRAQAKRIAAVERECAALRIQLNRLMRYRRT